MKKLIFGIFTASTLFLACNKTDIQQTTDSIKSADSIFKTAQESFKTLDSISKMVNDSNSTVGKVVVPELNKHKEIIEDAIKNGNISIDSLNKEFDKINTKTKQADEIRKAIDSANKAIKSGDNAALVIAETASKILKQTSKKNQTPTEPQAKNKSESEVQNQSQNQNLPSPQVEKYPISKTARLQISVGDIAASKALLNQELGNYNGDLITENFTENEGVAKEFITVKVPLNNFNELVNKISDFGTVESKTTEMEGRDYIGSQMCDVEITLVDKTPEKSTSNEDLNILNKDEKKDTFGDQSTDAFKKGFSGFGDVLLALIPFWPVALIGGLVWYFVARSNKKKREEEFQRQLALERERAKNTVNFQSIPQESSQNVEPTNPENKDDITRFMPKNDQ